MSYGDTIKKFAFFVIDALNVILISLQSFNGIAAFKKL